MSDRHRRHAAAAQAVTEAAILQEAGKWEDAIQVLIPHADSRNPAVEYALAYSYMSNATLGRPAGQLDAGDLAQAIRYAEMALQHGNAAAFNLLYMMHDSLAAVADPLKAGDYLRRGAEAGDAGSILNYAASLYEGTNIVARDVDRACPWIMAGMKDETTQVVMSHHFGLVLVRGQCGHKPDAAGGMDMIRIAARRGVRGAERDMGVGLEQGWAGPVDIPSALKWYERSAEHGDGYSLWRLGMAHVEGTLRPRDSVKAAEYFIRSTEAEHALGMGSLAVMYATGDGVPQDLGKALSLYEQSAAGGNPHAYRGLALMYMAGEGVIPDPVRAHGLYRKSVEMGNPEEPALEAAIEAMAREAGTLEFR